MNFGIFLNLLGKNSLSLSLSLSLICQFGFRGLKTSNLTYKIRNEIHSTFVNMAGWLPVAEASREHDGEAHVMLEYDVDLEGSKIGST
jgi:hypothetical protein